jgi:hypothetical protein
VGDWAGERGSRDLAVAAERAGTASYGEWGGGERERKGGDSYLVGKGLELIPRTSSSHARPPAGEEEGQDGRGWVY